ncbi:hypothetical protein GS506_21865 [Rhodococcus hoagii]|nr:hypothetical protein [Prescottella equi]
MLSKRWGRPPSRRLGDDRIKAARALTLGGKLPVSVPPTRAWKRPGRASKG